MNILYLTVGDTRPTACSYNEDLTGYSIVMQIGYPAPLVKAAVITAATLGVFEFPWADGDLLPGEWPADLVITDAAGKTATSVEFQVNVKGRVA